MQRRSLKGSRRCLPAVTISAALLFWLGCHKAPISSIPAVDCEVLPQPARVGSVTATFRLVDAAAKPVVGAHLAAEADMTHAGMSPVFGAVNEVQPGRYEAKLTLGMAGDWVILLHGTLPTGEKLERQFDLRNVQPN